MEAGRIRSDDDLKLFPVFCFLVLVSASQIFASPSDWAPLDSGGLGRADGTNSSEFCSDKGYPLAEDPDPLAAMMKSFEPCFVVGSRSSMSLAMGLPAAKIANSVNILSFQRAGEEFIPPDILKKIDKYLDDHEATSLLIVLGGQILLERYQYDRKPDMPIQTFGVDNLLMPILAGIALQEGLIASLDDPVTAYYEPLQNTEWDNVSINHILRSSSGIKFDPKIDRPVVMREMVSGSLAIDEILARFVDRAAAPGETLSTTMLDTYVLSRVLENAFSMPVEQLLSEKLWSQIGAEHDASIIKNSAGETFRKNFFSATARDYTRLGQILINKGKSASGEQIIPEDWSQLVLQGNKDLLKCPFGPGCTKLPFGYTFHNYVAKSGTSLSLGYPGNMIIMSADADMVVFQSSVAKDAKGNGALFKVLQELMKQSDTIKSNLPTKATDELENRAATGTAISQTVTVQSPEQTSNISSEAAVSSGSDSAMSAASSQTQLSVLDEIENRCVSYGFKRGNEAFGGCVLKLLDLTGD